MTPYEIIFKYQAQNVNFSDWVSQFTLCLAPLIAHILAGVPSPVYLCSHRPRWHDRFSHFNPTSILWRYFTIADRRARMKKWSPSHMSATNALFWTLNGWDGSEEMIEKSAPFLILEPRKTHMELLSISGFSTIIVTLQGVQALYVLVDSIAGSGQFTRSLSISSLFFPLATFGLMRLPAAFWLTDNKAYRNEDGTSTAHEPHRPSLIKECRGIAFPCAESTKLPEEYHPIRSWRGIAVRAFFLLVPLFLCIVCLTLFIPPPRTKVMHFTLTAFSLNLVYIFFFSVNIFTLAFCMVRSRSTTTILPCINSAWYKIYTGVLFAVMLFVFIVTALETRKAPCGVFTTWALELDDLICGGIIFFVPN